MFGRERNIGVSLGYIVGIVLLVAMVAGCVPITDPAWLVGPSPLNQAPATAVPEGEAEPVADAAAPSPITHRLARHEACLDCHAAETGREPAPADHRDLTEAVCLFCHMPEEGEAAIPPLPTEAEADFCLSCHGPFEELAARTEGAVIVKDVVTDPHMYVPHNSTKAFSCDNCHGVHTLPVSPEDVIAQADAQYCFQACHHTEDFRPCESCHDEDEDE